MATFAHLGDKEGPVFHLLGPLPQEFTLPNATQALRLLVNVDEEVFDLEFEAQGGLLVA